MRASVRGYSSGLLLAVIAGLGACADDGGGDDEIGASETESSDETTGDESTSESSESSTDSTESSTDSTDESSTDSTDATEESTDTTGGEPPMLPLCGTPPPEGAQLAPPLPTYPGCPLFEPGVENLFMTGGGERSFILVAPADIQDDELLPVMFMFHWLGADADSFFNKAEVQ